MSYTRPLPYRFRLLGIALGLLMLGAMAIALGAPEALAYDDRRDSALLEASSVPQSQEAEDRDPEANLPYLFAVFIITWAVLFGYVFVMSRRQRAMQEEIEVLRAALAEREDRKGESKEGVDSAVE